MVVLNRCGLTEEQKAVVLARANGKLQREDIGRALRSCYPEMLLNLAEAVQLTWLKMMVLPP